MSEVGAAPLVHPSLDTAWWWTALGQGELLMPTCGACGNRFFPPQAFCPNCGSDDWSGAKISGRGTIYSWIVTHRAFSAEFSGDVPYAIVAVDMAEGGRLIGRYLGDHEALRDALPVLAQLCSREGQNLLGFRQAPTGSLG